MQRKSHPLILAAALTTLTFSGAALSAGFPTGSSSGTSSDRPPLTITPPSPADGNRLIVDVNTVPLDVNLFAGQKRVAAKESIYLHGGGHVYQSSAKEAIDLPALPGLPQ